MHLPGEKSPRSRPADFLFFLEVGHAITVSLKKSEKESNRQGTFCFALGGRICQQEKGKKEMVGT